MKTPEYRRPDRGFTLIEILVSLAILTTALVVLAQGYVNTLNALRSGEDHSNREQDIFFVRERILRTNTREYLENGGTLETLTSGPIHWEAEIEETDVLDVFRLYITMEFLDSRDHYSRQLTVLRPNWSDPVERETLLQEKRESIEASRFGKEWAPQ